MAAVKLRRVLLLTGPSPGRPGGVATFVRTLTRALASELPDLDVELFPTDKGGRGAGRLTDGLRVALRLRRRLRAGAPALLHLSCGSDRRGWGLREAALQVATARRAGVPALLHLHASAFEHLWRRRAERLHIRWTLNRCRAVAVLSPGQREALIARGVPGERVHVIPNGVAVPPVDPPEARVATSAAPLRLLLVGSVEPRKGLEELLDALETVRQARGPVVRVDVLGPDATSPDRVERWRRRGEPLGLHFAGPVAADRIPGRLAASDGLVLPSRAEGLPFALLEAMAACRPVIATRTGAIEELLRGAGDLVEPRSSAQLAAALIGWVDEPGRRPRLAEAGWRRVRETASVDVTLRATLVAWAGALGVDSTDEALTLLGAPAQPR